MPRRQDSPLRPGLTGPCPLAGRAAGQVLPRGLGKAGGGSGLPSSPPCVTVPVAARGRGSGGQRGGGRAGRWGLSRTQQDSRPSRAPCVPHHHRCPRWRGPPGSSLLQKRLQPFPGPATSLPPSVPCPARLCRPLSPGCPCPRLGRAPHAARGKDRRCPWARS